VTRRVSTTYQATMMINNRTTNKKTLRMKMTNWMMTIWRKEKMISSGMMMKRQKTNMKRIMKAFKRKKKKKY
jgi:hypothetical protein